MSKYHLFECWEKRVAGRGESPANATLLVSTGLCPDREVRECGGMVGRKCFTHESNREQKNVKKRNKQIIPHGKDPRLPNLHRGQQD